MIELLKKCPIFIHIPRTGGNSIFKAFPTVRHWYHFPVSGVRKKMSKNNFDKSFKFTIVRNPYDRLVSTYFYIMQTQKGHKYHRTNKQFLSLISQFKDFQDMCFNLQSKQIKNLLYIKKQIHYICDKSSNLMINHVFKFENMEQNFKDISERCNLPMESVAKENESVHNSWQQYYTKETSEIVYDFYKEDFDFFGYDKYIVD